MSKFTPIPDFAPTLDSMATSLRATKAAVEEITGARQGQASVAMIYTQSYPPTASQGVQRGYLWLNTESGALKWWDGFSWKATT